MNSKDNKKIQHKMIRENPLIVGENYFIIIGEKGSISKFINKKKLQWSRNIYSKGEKISNLHWCRW